MEKRVAVVVVGGGGGSEDPQKIKSITLSFVDGQLRMCDLNFPKSSDRSSISYCEAAT